MNYEESKSIKRRDECKLNEREQSGCHIGNQFKINLLTRLDSKAPDEEENKTRTVGLVMTGSMNFLNWMKGFYETGYIQW